MEVRVDDWDTGAMRVQINGVARFVKVEFEHMLTLHLEPVDARDLAAALIAQAETTERLQTQAKI